MCQGNKAGIMPLRAESLKESMKSLDTEIEDKMTAAREQVIQSPKVGRI